MKPTQFQGEYANFTKTASVVKVKPSSLVLWGSSSTSCATGSASEFWLFPVECHTYISEFQVNSGSVIPPTVKRPDVLLSNWDKEGSSVCAKFGCQKWLGSRLATIMTLIALTGQAIICVPLVIEDRIDLSSSDMEQPLELSLNCLLTLFGNACPKLKSMN